MYAHRNDTSHSHEVCQNASSAVPKDDVPHVMLCAIQGKKQQGEICILMFMYANGNDTSHFLQSRARRHHEQGMFAIYLSLSWFTLCIGLTTPHLMCSLPGGERIKGGFKNHGH